MRTLIDVAYFFVREMTCSETVSDDVTYNNFAMPESPSKNENGVYRDCVCIGRCGKKNTHLAILYKYYGSDSH